MLGTGVSCKSTSKKSLDNLSGSHNLIYIAFFYRELPKLKAKTSSLREKLHFVV